MATTLHPFVRGVKENVIDIDRNAVMIPGAMETHQTKRGGARPGAGRKRVCIEDPASVIAAAGLGLVRDEEFLAPEPQDIPSELLSETPTPDTPAPAPAPTPTPITFREWINDRTHRGGFDLLDPRLPGDPTRLIVELERRLYLAWETARETAQGGEEG